MRKLFFALATVVMFTLTSQAQVRFGAKAGMNISKITAENWVTKNAYHAGLYAQISLAPQFSIQPELLYSQQGSQYDSKQDIYYHTISMHSDLTTHNILLPIMLQYTPIKYLTIEAGPQLGFNFGTKLYYNMNISGILLNTQTDQTLILENKYINQFEFALAAGLKVNITKNINLYARYVFGMTPVFTEEVSKYNLTEELGIPIDIAVEDIYDLGEIKDIKNHTIMFGLGFTL